MVSIVHAHQCVAWDLFLAKGLTLMADLILKHARTVFPTRPDALRGNDRMFIQVLMVQA